MRHTPTTIATTITRITALGLIAVTLGACGTTMTPTADHDTSPADTHDSAHNSSAPNDTEPTSPTPTPSAVALPPLQESPHKALTPAAREACQPSQLTATLEPPQGSAGHLIYPLKIQNTGPHCTLAGFPGVSAVTHDGQQIGLPATRHGDSAPPIRLGPSASATLLLRLTRTEVLDPDICRPTAAAGIKMYPPNSFDALTIPAQIQVCAGEIATMDITAFDAN